MPGEPIRWARLEPAARDRELAPGLEARVHDPLWLLARQWQFGEFAAVDGGSAIVAQVSASVAPMAKLRPGRPSPTARTSNYSVPAVPLETLVEADDLHAAPTARMRVRAGQHFERMLAARNLGQYAGPFRTAYPIAATTPPVADAAGRRFLALVAGRAIDGEKLYKDLKVSLRATPPALPAAPVIPAADAAAVIAVAQAWVAWFDALAFTPSGGPAAWVQDRLEYAFGTGTPDGIALEADEYADGHLDWHTFTAAGTTANPPAGRSTLGPVTVVPTAVTYPGMPASRLWEFEDGRVNFGAVSAEPEDLGRMLLSGFALVYGADWLMVPLEVPVGTLVRITRLDVKDTFGRTTTVGPTAPGGEWRMFELSRAEGGSEDALLVAPALGASLQGRDVEDVLLLRDEVANLAWAVEKAVEGEDGLPADQARAAGEAAAPAPPVPPPDGAVPYRLRTDPPPYWFPLMPQRAVATNPSMSFRLGALPRVSPSGPVTPLRPRGRLLTPLSKDPKLLLREDEVPREGARVTRAYQLARWMDGSTFLWLGRRKTVGRGEGSSGLRFDTTEPPT
ncbi:hypothetical protein OM076_15560 [Solirubrobacter ginsenosidimutans]|uniref:Uncharacterized protein n=1 Tax=Solirubrobacter ginsenosidimutans TaxID=490573 RepID=A0A9X3MSE3_9ACTN|nr:hypothetical protein [Solirubrobacter ginsenosidimutans]MDA0161695.1 hypothetical protein [Solirubrobacter ginsenosidimutans]